LYRSCANADRIKSVSQETQTATAKLLELAARWPRYGYRRLTAEMRKAGFKINK
jgi:hypothetical protein